MPADEQRPEQKTETTHEKTHVSKTNEVDYRCDLCGAPMHEWHCRIICNACGYQRDCSDP